MFSLNLILFIHSYSLTTENMSTNTKLVMNKNNLSTDSTVLPHEWIEGLNANVRQLGTSIAMECVKQGAGPFGANHPGLGDDEHVPMVLPPKEVYRGVSP